MTGQTWDRPGQARTHPGQAQDKPRQTRGTRGGLQKFGPAGPAVSRTRTIPALGQGRKGQDAPKTGPGQTKAGGGLQAQRQPQGRTNTSQGQKQPGQHQPRDRTGCTQDRPRTSQDRPGQTRSTTGAGLTKFGFARSTAIQGAP